MKNLKTITVIFLLTLVTSVYSQTRDVKASYLPNSSSSWSNSLNATDSYGYCFSFLDVSLQGKKSSYKKFVYRIVVTNNSRVPVSFGWQWQGEGSGNRTTIKANSTKTLSSFSSNEEGITVVLSKARAILMEDKQTI